MNVFPLAVHAARASIFRNAHSAMKAGVTMARHERAHKFFMDIVTARNGVCRVQLDATREYRSKLRLDVASEGQADRMLASLQLDGAHKAIKRLARISVPMQGAVLKDARKGMLPKLQREIDHLSAQQYKYTIFIKAIAEARANYCQEKCSMAEFDRMLQQYE